MISILVAASLSVPVVLDEPPFPAAPPGDVGLDPAALEAVADVVEGLVSSDAVVGAELHVISGRRTVLHRAWGHADRDDDRPLEVGAVHCVRSMTKPLVGTLVQMLIDERRLSRDTLVGEVLPSWADDTVTTVGHLLTHTSGLPYSTITQPLASYGSILDVAAEAATVERLFAPGTDFQYSDAGSDTLGAVVETISGEPIADVVTARLLEPLGMSDSITSLADTPLDTARVPSAYSGGPGRWTRHWRPDDGPLFPIFLTSQSLYATTTDYARFIALWLDRGRDLVSHDAVVRALVPRHRVPSTEGLDGLRSFYGEQWVVYAASVDDAPAAFGHSGSDGTHVWAWPEHDLIVLYFTQSRGTTSGGAVERVVDRVLVQGDLEGHLADLEARERSAGDLAPYEGLFWDETNPIAYYVVRRGGGGLVLERPGAFVQPLVTTPTPGRFEFEGLFGPSFTFDEPRDGASDAFVMASGEGEERQVRHRPRGRLSLDEIVAGLREAHRLDAADDLGVVRMTGTIEVVNQRRSGEVEMVFDRDRLRMLARMDTTSEEVRLVDGRAFHRTGDEPFVELSGEDRARVVHAHPLGRLGDWRETHASVEPLKAVVAGTRAVIVVRVVPREGPGTTKLVDAESGALLGEDVFESIPGLGLIGARVRFDDLRDVGGVALPWRVVAEYATPLIGEIVTTYTDASVRVDPGDALTIPAGF